MRRVAKAIFRLLGRRPEIPHGEAGIRQVGHRRYVGGKWDEIGRLQFDFLLAQGLKPHHYLLDIACGSLRAGVYMIPYLDRAHYMGVEKEPDLIRAGRERELGPDLERDKAPELLVSSTFEFERLSAQPDYAIAQSLFTHLPSPQIDLCFQKLRAVVREDGQFFATYFETVSSVQNPAVPHDHMIWRYTPDDMLAFGQRNGWSAEYIGDWHHPRGQVMVRYRPR